MKSLSKIFLPSLFIILLAGLCRGRQTNELGDTILSDTEVQQFNLAEQGDAGAQAYLGCIYAEGQGVPKDAITAAKWFRMAAVQGNAGAQHRLGWCYHLGQGVLKDEAKAVDWYRAAAIQGSIPAQKMLETMAEAGNASAQSSLGWMYENGKGVVQDTSEANKWYDKARVSRTTADSNVTAFGLLRESPAPAAKSQHIDFDAMPQSSQESPAAKFDPDAFLANTAAPPAATAKPNAGSDTLPFLVGMVLLFLLIYLLKSRRVDPLAAYPATPEQRPFMSKRLRIIAAVLYFVVIGGTAAYKTINGIDSDAQRRVDYEAHPIASVSGSVAPSLVIAPFLYWLLGRPWRKKRGPTPPPLPATMDNQTPPPIENMKPENKKENPAMDPVKKSVLVAVAVFGLLLIFFMPYTVTEAHGSTFKRSITQRRFITDTPPAYATTTSYELSAKDILLYLLVASGAGAVTWALSGRRK